MRAIVFVAAIAAAPLTQATTINFDDRALGDTPLSNQYASQGILFENIEASNRFSTSALPVSAPIYASPFWLNTNPGDFFFEDPANSSAAIVDSVSITLNAYNNVGGWFSGAVIDVLDPFGNVIVGQTQTISPTNFINRPAQTLTFTGPIHEVRFTRIANPSGPGIFPFDDVTFGALTDVPEPSTLAITGMLLAAFAARRRRSA